MLKISYVHWLCTGEIEKCPGEGTGQQRKQKRNQLQYDAISAIIKVSTQGDGISEAEVMSCGERRGKVPQTDGTVWKGQKG